jgi:membrane peptidoglycan carboxypeptidase
MAATPPKPAKKSKTRKPAARSRLRGCLQLFVGGGCTSFVAVALASLAVVVAAVVGLAIGYRRYIVDDPGPQFDEANIKSVIAEESPVFYRDGSTRIGVFFEDEHREYLAFEDIPVPWAVAIVAAEDGGFWTHYGIDPKHVVRALAADIASGHVVAGGSTLTQQTAKNLFYRPDRSLKSKADEFLNALRLEAHYDKSHILEFYANQFHVSGNGRGLGIAARYFFDKEASELDLVECAYIAGLVKGPTNYDPFLGDADKQATAKQRAHDRVRYVLQRIVDEDADALAGPFPDRLATVATLKQQAQDLLDHDFEIPFHQGTFRYDKNAVIDEVARRLGEEPYKTVLADLGVADPATSGLRVITTLDPDVQRESIYGLWHTLTEYGTMLEARTAKDFVLDEEAPHPDPDRALHRHEFTLAAVTAHTGDNGKKTLEIDLGGIPGVLDRDALTRAALAIYRGERKDKNAKVSAASVDQLATNLADGAVVFVSIRDLPEGKPVVCDLELKPTLQGSTMVLEDGQVRAMVGGNDNRDYNRARAIRQMGSTWKPVTFHTAIALGWSPAMILQNSFDVYAFEGVFYWPTEDHTTSPAVSMSWAGVNSENLASVWLLYHLTDVLDGAGSATLAANVELARLDGEDAATYRARLAKAGVAPGGSARSEAAYLYARRQVLTSAMTHPEDALALEGTPPGTGFDAERARVAKDPKLRTEKQAILEHTWDRIAPLLEPCQQQYRLLERAVLAGDVPSPGTVPDLTLHVDGDLVNVACGAAPDGYAPPSEGLLAGVLDQRRRDRIDDPPEPERATDAPVRNIPEPDNGSVRPGGRHGGRKPADPPPTPTRPSRPAETPKWSTDAPTWHADDAPAPIAGDGTARLAALDDMLVGGRLHFTTAEAVRRAVVDRTAAIAGTDPLDPDVLYWTQDFRTLLGIRAVVHTARAYGVQSALTEVLPLTLGASEITLEEATSLYDGLTTGSAWDLQGTSRGAAVAAPADPTVLIERIEDVDGNVLYAANPQPVAVNDPAVAAMTDDILRNVVRYGTAKRADGAIVHGKVGIPLGGKTGTTNEYRNSAFLGYVPHASGAGYAVDGGFTVGVYVGYDDNRPMDVGNLKVAGATIALPAWLWTVQGLEEAGLLGEPEGKGTAPQWPIAVPDGLVRLPADPTNGLVHDGAAAQGEPGVLTVPIAIPVGPTPVTVADERPPSAGAGGNGRPTPTQH